MDIQVKYCLFSMMVQRVHINLPSSVLVRVTWEKGDQLTSTKWVRLNQSSIA